MSQNHSQPNFAEAEMDDQDEGRVIEGGEVTALAQLNSAEINQQIVTARAYPRSVVGFRRNMREMVTYDEATALSCLYALKRSGKVIEGPSIRFAEAAVQAWGNVRCGARVVDIGEEFITGQGFFYDLEKNVAIAVEVMRRITNREGERFGEDMIAVTGNAACSIALRNAILRGIPKTAWLDPYQQAKQLSVGKGESITVKRENMIKAFAPVGVSKEQIFGLLGVKGADDVTIDQLMFLAGVLNSIKEGGEKAEEIFAMSNMVNPSQVLPPRPKASEFKQADKVTPEKKPDAQTTTQAQVTEQAQHQAEQKPGPDITAAEQERLDWIAEAYADLEKQTKLVDNKTGGGVSNLRERVIEAGVMNAEEEAKWVTACDAKAKAIMDAKKANK